MIDYFAIGLTHALLALALLRLLGRDDLDSEDMGAPPPAEPRADARPARRAPGRRG